MQVKSLTTNSVIKVNYVTGNQDKNCPKSGEGNKMKFYEARIFGGNNKKINKEKGNARYSCGKKENYKR